MPQYIAFLRGINVGGHRIKMDELRELFEEIGLTEVSTFIASGNVIFTSESGDEPRLVERIEDHLLEELGYEVSTFLRTPDRLEEIVSLGTSEGEAGGEFASTYVILLRAPAPDEVRAELESYESETDAFGFSGLEVHWKMKGKLSESPLFNGPLERIFKGVPNTMRNNNTLRRLVAKLR